MRKGGIPRVDELSRCSNDACDARLACERAQPAEGAKMVCFNEGRKESEGCGHFIVRSALGGGNSDLVFERGRGRRGRRHNAHAPERKDAISAAEALFGSRLTEDCRPSRRDNYGVLGKTEKPDLLEGRHRPDLLVKRHIKYGRDINKEGNE